MTERQGPGGQESDQDIVDVRDGAHSGADQRSMARRRRQEVAARLRAERAARGSSVPGGQLGQDPVVGQRGPVGGQVSPVSPAPVRATEPLVGPGGGQGAYGGQPLADGMRRVGEAGVGGQGGSVESTPAGGSGVLDHRGAGWDGPVVGDEPGPVMADRGTHDVAGGRHAVGDVGATVPLRERLGFDDLGGVEPGPVASAQDVGGEGGHSVGPHTPAEPFAAVEPEIGGVPRRADRRAERPRGVVHKVRGAAGVVGASVRHDKVTPKLVVVALVALLVGVLVGALLPRGGAGADSATPVEGAPVPSGALNPANGLDSVMNCVPGQFVAFVAAVGPPKAYTTAVGTMYLQVGRAEETTFGSGVLHLTRGENLCEAATVGYTDMANRADWYFLWAGTFATKPEAESWCTAMGYQSLETECIIQPAG